MFTYICLGTNDLERSCRFYDAVMGTLGLSRCDLSGEPNWEGWAAFFAAAIANGGQSEGEPGLRPQYNADFYAAYVRDPDENKLAAVCRGFTASRS
jgi:catechol 2,3-dioxygenase-like lactoylglutathione lyase family enzyme